MKYVSKQLLDELYVQTESNLSKAVSEWQFLSDSVMTAQPGPGAWSASQCLEHLNSYGRYYLPAIEKAFSKAAGNRSTEYFISSWLGNYFYKLMLPENDGSVKKKMKSPKDHRPAQVSDPGKALYEFIEQLERLGSLLTRAQEINLNAARVPISISPFIKLKLGDVFLFLTAHIKRHVSQAERALQATGSGERDKALHSAEDNLADL
ncbi:MAG TPA: DinB family protein [Ferruginibacter sp.]|nr:DinB family protein [Ferruginibacter sp.]